MNLTPIPKGFVVNFNPGHCGACDTVITSGIFCSNCLPVLESKNPGISLTDQQNLLRTLTDPHIPHTFFPQLLEPDVVSNLEVDVVAFIRSSDLFLGDDFLWVLANTTVVFYPDLHYSAMIRKTRTGLIEVVYSTVDKEAIYTSYPDESNAVPSLIVHFVSSF